MQRTKLQQMVKMSLEAFGEPERFLTQDEANSGHIQLSDITTRLNKTLFSTGWVMRRDYVSRKLRAAWAVPGLVYNGKYNESWPDTHFRDYAKTLLKVKNAYFKRVEEYAKTVNGIYLNLLKEVARNPGSKERLDQLLSTAYSELRSLEKPIDWFENFHLEVFGNETITYKNGDFNIVSKPCNISEIDTLSSFIPTSKIADVLKDFLKDGLWEDQLVSIATFPRRNRIYRDLERVGVPTIYREQTETALENCKFIAHANFDVAMQEILPSPIFKAQHDFITRTLLLINASIK